MYSRRKFFLPLALLTAGFVSCQPQKPQPKSKSSDSDSSPLPVNQIYLNGAGATFPAILYERWFNEYHRQNPEIIVNYQAIGSAAGIKQIIAETVDFGGSDVGISEAEIRQASREVILLPMTAGSIALVYNLPGIESGLKLSRQVYPEIFLGKIKRWNDPKIAALNPDVKLPDLPIVVIYRSDGSGTTATFTAHLSTISSEWNSKVGTGLNVSWSAGVGIKSNAGVSAQVMQAEGSISYVEYGYAQQLDLSMAAIANKAGKYIQPNIQTTANALNSSQLPENLLVFINDPEGLDSYPIVTYSWLLVYKKYDDAKKAQALKELIQWCLNQGQKLSESLGYVPLSPNVVKQVLAKAQAIS
jgi:phosphate transport system substrate-binding protein